MIGQEIENYRILSKLGEGGMGSVYRALDVHLDRVVALKLLGASLANNPQMEAGLRAEFRAQASLNHQNIASVYSFLKWEDKAVVVMEYVHGKTLQQLIAERGALPLETALALCKQALYGVGAAHRQGIVHRDLKPANLMLSNDGVVKVLDFGMAQIKEVNQPRETSAYMAPEQVLNKNVDGRTDIYSLGVTLFELLTGELPFEGDTVFALHMAQVSERPRDPREINPEIPSAVASAVLRALAKDPGDRFATAEEFIRALPRLSDTSGQFLQRPLPERRAATVIEEAGAISAVPPPFTEPSGSAKRNLQDGQAKPPSPPLLGSAARSVSPVTAWSPLTSPTSFSRDLAANQTAQKGSSEEPKASNATVVKVFYATDRLKLPFAIGGSVFSKNRAFGGALHLGECEVSIPKAHRMGKLESPSILRLEFRPNTEKHIVLMKTRDHDEASFVSSVRAAVERSSSRELFIFVHGYNVTFEDAARRTGQMTYDLEFSGAPVFYSWPSAGQKRNYIRDETNSKWSTPHFQRFLQLLAHNAGAERIHLIAHSLGNRLVCDALEALSGAGQIAMNLTHLILAAPDIDAETLVSLSMALKRLARRITLYESSNDKALQASRKIHGYARAGEPVLVIPGFDAIDASAIDTDFLGHSYFSDNWPLLSDIHSILSRDNPPETRFGLMRREHVSGEYFAFKKP